MLGDALEDLHWLGQIQPAARAEVGDKAYYLGLLEQRGFPVVPGFVISTRVMRRFLSSLDWQEPLFADFPDSSLHVDVDRPQQLRAIAQKMRQSILTSPLWDDWLAVVEAQVQQWRGPDGALPLLILRPSLGLDAGLDPSFSGRVRGLIGSQICLANREAIALALRQVWAELFRAKSLFVWQRSRLQLQQLHLGVLVQPIHDAVAAGTAHVRATDCEIHAIWGLGAALAWGELAPDRFLLSQAGATAGAAASEIAPMVRQIHPKPHRYRLQHDLNPTAVNGLLCPHPALQIELLEPAQQRQPSLTEAQLKELVDLAAQVHQILGSSIDLEWTLAAEGAAAQPQFRLTQLNVLFPRAVAAAPALVSAAPAPSPAHPLPPLKGVAAAAGQVAAQVWVVDDLSQVPPDLPPGRLLVMSYLPPTWLGLMQRASGIVTEQGGMTSHGAILAREMGVPAVVGVEGATQVLRMGEWVRVDGDRGLVYRLESAPSRSGAIAAPERPPTALPSDRLPTQTQLLLALNQPTDLDALAALPSDGVGLVRAEHLLLPLLKDAAHLVALGRSGEAPLTQQNGLPGELAGHFAGAIAQKILPIAAAFAPRPVFYRSLDVRSQDFPGLQPRSHQPELNPTLGLHGAFSYQVNPAWLDAELAALRQLQQTGHANIRLILPFVRGVEEVQFCRQRVLQAGLFESPEFQLWIMAEVPAVLFLLPELVQAGVQGIAIGSNDLTQLLLAADRDLTQLAEAFQPRHPAVQRAIQHLAQTARQLGLPSMLCGELPSQHLDLVDDWVRWGMTALCVTPGAVRAVQWAIARAETRHSQASDQEME
ncbi:MAG: hypothetical protein Fur0046_23280 [Cyanobacteria bacterium J069]